MPLRGAAAGALLTATALLTVPVAATAVPGGSAAPAAEVVGGPDLAAKGIVLHPGPGSTPLPAVDADTWLVADLTTGQVLAAKGAHTRVLPASTLKTLTVITLMPRLDRNQVVTATWEEARADGGHVGIVPGATYSVWDLWHGLLLPSANDAAAALADANGGMAQTVAQMQAMAHRLRADDTTVKNDSGLDTPGQLSSAYDMALMARAALAIPDFLTVSQTIHYAFPGRPAVAGAPRSTYQIYTQDRLLLHHFPGTIAGKTGFTSLAHRTFWGAASRGGHTIVATLFQIHEPTETAVKALLTWGFANTGKVTPVGTLVAPLDDEAPANATTAAASGGGGTTAAGAVASASGDRAPWVPIALVALLLAVAGGGALWWRRRRRSPARTGVTPPIGPAASTDAVAPVPTSVRASRPAATATPSVVVSPPARPTPPPVQVPPTDAADDITVPATAPAATVGRPEAERTEPTQATDVADATGPGGPAEPDEHSEPEPKPAPPRPTGGNVRIITPPGRPPAP